MLFGSNRSKPVQPAPGQWGSNRAKAEVKPPKADKPKAETKPKAPKAKGKSES